MNWNQPTKGPLIMGILNATPDSFSDGGQWIAADKATSFALKMIDQGANIIDVGGESTRPGAEAVSEQEELKRVIPIIEAIRSKSDCDISIDTTKSSVAKAAVKAGATLLNDIHGLQGDPKMAQIAAELDLPICIMHFRKHNDLAIDIMSDIDSFFRRSLKIAQETGIKKSNIILDPGIGFGKSVNQNYEILQKIDQLKRFELPILLGCSRKSLIGAVDKSSSENRIGGTLATTAHAFYTQIEIIRVHDVAENHQAIQTLLSIQTGALQCQ